MEQRMYCVYNQTRECFLSLGVPAADTPFARLKGLIGKLSLRSGEGSWIVPSSGIHTIGVLVPLDLIYLDDKLRVIHLIEHFPTFSIAPLRAQSESVLEMAAHSIYSSQTQVGDQLLICAANEMDRWLNNAAPRTAETDSAGPQRVNTVPKKSWIRRMFSKDRRRAARHKPAPLLAFYWDGAEPKAHGIRDVSRTGIYLVTEHRWYPGTVVTVTLQRAEAVAGDPERAIAVNARVVRSGDDGVGLAFVLSPATDLSCKDGTANQADEKTLHSFIRRVLPDGEQKP